MNIEKAYFAAILMYIGRLHQRHNEIGALSEMVYKNMPPEPYVHFRVAATYTRNFFCWHSAFNNEKRLVVIRFMSPTNGIGLMARVCDAQTLKPMPEIKARLISNDDLAQLQRSPLGFATAAYKLFNSHIVEALNEPKPDNSKSNGAAILQFLKRHAASRKAAKDCVTSILAD